MFLGAEAVDYRLLVAIIIMVDYRRHIESLGLFGVGAVRGVIVSADGDNGIIIYRHVGQMARAGQQHGVACPRGVGAEGGGVDGIEQGEGRVGRRRHQRVGTVHRLAHPAGSAAPDAETDENGEREYVYQSSHNS